MKKFNKFELETFGLPEAGKLVSKVQYNIFRKYLVVYLSENNELNAQRWLLNIKDIFDKAKSFPNLKSKDQIALHLFANKDKVATLRFGGLLIQGHRCKTLSTGLEHKVKIGFERIEIDS